MAETKWLRLLLAVLMTSSGIGDREKRQDTVPATAQPILQSSCTSSLTSSPLANPTPLSTTQTDCSLGKVKRSLQDNEELRAGGLYLMPEAVACNGELVLVETCAFLNRLMNTTRFSLNVVVYREKGTHELDRIRITNLDIRSNASQGCGNISRRWSVKKGDRVGVRIWDTCDTADDSDLACPANANLIDATCTSALYLRLGRSPHTLSDFTTVGVNLNVRASIVPTTSQPLLQSTCNSTHYVTPSPLPTPLSDCSLGKVKRSLLNNEELKAGGLYLMPEAVACNGELVLVETCAFLNRLMNTTRFSLNVVVYREKGTHELDRIRITNLDIRSNASQGCGNISRRWSVNKGDRVGVRIHNTCDDPEDPDPACPAQANLIDTGCASALYLHPSTSPRTLSDFSVVGVNLNMRVSIVPTTPAPQPTTTLQPMESTVAGQTPRSAIYSLTSTYLLAASSSRFEAIPNSLPPSSSSRSSQKLYSSSISEPGTVSDTMAVPSTPAPQPTTLLQPVQSEATPDLLPPSSSSRSLQKLHSSSITEPGTVSNTMEISHGAIGGIVVAALVVTTALVMLLTITTYVYCTMGLKKRKGNYQYTETNDHQVAVISYHVGSKDEVFVSYEQPADDISPQKSMNHTISSSENSYRESFRNRGYSEPNAYSQIGSEVTTTETVTMFGPYSGPCSEPYVHANAGASVPSHSPPNKIPTHYEVNEDYEDPYWEPSSREDELRRQLLELKVQEIPREDLQLYECLGSGQFGTVNRGVWSPSLYNSSPGVEVAVKSLEGSLSEEERVKFLQEAVIMGQFKHPNIIRVIGVFTTSDPFLIVCEMMHKGDLHHHLLSLRPQSGSLPAEMPAQLLSFSRQVAFGMTYLSNKSFVHRDLAARNILVSEYDICKIADFGLSRNLQKEDFYVSHGGKIPVKWTAPEALNYRKYSASSDVWSYGVLLYEIWAMGIKPFHNCTNNECLKKVLAGYRLPPPPGCPRVIYEWMMRCWHPQPESRPTFTDTVVLLQRPDFQLLRWSAEDEVAYSEKARTLGGPVEDGNELFTELQEVFSKPAAS